MIYAQGSMVRLGISIDINRSPGMPNALSLCAKTDRTQVVLAGDDIVEDAPGQFHVELQATRPGSTCFEWRASYGNRPIVLIGGKFKVEKSSL